MAKKVILPTNNLPTLYSFRRCPYAIRARMAIYCAGIDVNLVEVSLKNKPQAMLDASSKGTVPVLCLCGEVIDESLEIMVWALNLNDPDGWWVQCSSDQKNTMGSLIDKNDNEFKACLDKYKYASRFPEYSPEHYRQRCDVFLSMLNKRLEVGVYLLGNTMTMADVAIFPFVRQFSLVDKTWFDQSEYKAVQIWLAGFLALPLFVQIMEKG